MLTIFLIRHGENDYLKTKRLPGHTPGVSLNECGQRQAQALAEKLSQAPIQAVYSSPLERAMETAAPLAAALSLPVISRPGLIETDIGEWQGESLKRLSRRKVWKQVQETPSTFRFPGGESFAECQQRMVAEIEALFVRHAADEMIACFSHADPIRLTAAHYLGMPLDLFQRLEIAPASVSALKAHRGSMHLLYLNLYPGGL